MTRFTSKTIKKSNCRAYVTMNESKPAKRYIYRAYANKQVVSKQTKLAKIPSTLLALAGRDSFRV